MNDAEFEAQKERVTRLIKRWQETLGLAAWDIDHIFTRGDFESNGSPAPGVLATTTVDWKYMHATIDWNMPRVLDNDDRTLEYAFLHEKMHVFLHELRPWHKKENLELVDEMEREHEEHVATMLGWAILWTREAVEREFKAKYEGC